MTFEREERVAFARILSDLIEADFIIEENEIMAFDKVKDEKDFNITMSILSEAKTKTLAEAVNILQALRDEEKKTCIIKKLYEMALSDGNCVSLEALLTIAVKYALEGRGEVFSIPYRNHSIDNMTVLYIENEDNTEVDDYICSHYRAISNEFRLAGFNFVYIPRIANDYKQIKGEYLYKVIKYMMPTLEEHKVETIQKDLCSMTTSKFTHELLFKKMGINVLKSKPAFLFKIGESLVADKDGMIDMEHNTYSNFLLVHINKMRKSTNGTTPNTVLNHIVDLMDSYRSLISGKLMIENLPLSNKFRYYSFHRSLFDLVVYGKKPGNYKLVINLKNCKKPVVLRPFDVETENMVEYDKELVIKLYPQEHALYILMVYLSLSGENIDWTDYPSMDNNRKLILEKYNLIYKQLGKGNRATEYRDKTHVSHIKKALKAHSSVVSNIDLFIPDKVLLERKHFYNVPIPPNLVYVLEGPKGKEREVKMVDSEFWKSHFCDDKK